MTGGSLPAMTWHGIMKYAHQGIELKPLAGIPVPPARKDTVVAESRQKQNDAPPPRPPLLTKKGADVLINVERMMDEANRALGPMPAAANEDRKRGASLGRTGSLMSELENASIARPAKN
jgi:penicillin-binding protein 1A